METYADLMHMIELLEKGYGVHVCIHDIEGITEHVLLKTDPRHAIHSTAFCEAAKSTAHGYNRCITHKNRANVKAINEKKAFFGYCPYGVFEAAKPVIINDHVVCIVYVGNVTANRGTTQERIQKTCGEMGISDEVMLEKAEKLTCLEDESICVKTAEAIDTFIRLLYEKKTEAKIGSRHWVVKRMIDHATINSDKNLTLRNMSMLYFVEEKYLGRLFKKQMGVSFSEYVNSLRMVRAAELLRSTNDKMIDISDKCGYNNVTYFNRVFERYYHMSPTEYRRLHS